ncbi:sortase [Candidatus Saccharibacteria bacterium]|nr:sortase [Candidatus Saccharibacteria bacterium]
MNSDSGGRSSDARQRQTAAEIARQKVLASYGDAAKTATYKQAPVQATQKNNADWRKYHSAWQNYYQKYYSDYYAKAAKEYIQTERSKMERRQKDEEYARQVREASRQPIGAGGAIISSPGVNERVANKKSETLPSPSMITSTPDEDEKQNITIALKKKIQARASDAAERTRKSKRFIPLILGVSVVLIALFLQYNRLIFAPIMAYVSPGNVSDNGITAIDATVTANPGPDPKLIIPKLNVDVPIHFGISNDEATVMDAMNSGVAQFSIPGASAMPGQVGNLAISGHSAGDIYSNNQYKFIFSGLERLVAGDTIYINYESKRYTYTVTKLNTVEPTDVAALVYETKKPMLTLITCTPLGTSQYRLLVTAEQVDPAPETATKVEQPSKNSSNESAMPSNEPSFFEGIWGWLTGQG